MDRGLGVYIFLLGGFIGFVVVGAGGGVGALGALLRRASGAAHSNAARSDRRRVRRLAHHVLRRGYVAAQLITGGFARAS